jgi:hypothetical protein
MQWLQLFVTIVGLITIFIQIGNKQGKQEEKNKNFEETQNNHREKFAMIENDLSIIKTDIGFIKGKLL